jgi:hypothetical protein
LKVEKTERSHHRGVDVMAKKTLFKYSKKESIAVKISVENFGGLVLHEHLWGTKTKKKADLCPTTWEGKQQRRRTTIFVNSSL